MIPPLSRWGALLVGLSGLLVVVALLVWAFWPSTKAPPPGAPVELAWDDTQNTAHDGYEVSRREDISGSAWVVLAHTAAQTRTYRDTAVLMNQRLCYVVRTIAQGGQVQSAPSNEVCAKVSKG